MLQLQFFHSKFATWRWIFAYNNTADFELVFSLTWKKMRRKRAEYEERKNYDDLCTMYIQKPQKKQKSELANKTIPQGVLQ